MAQPARRYPLRAAGICLVVGALAASMSLVEHTVVSLLVCLMVLCVIVGYLIGQSVPLVLGVMGSQVPNLGIVGYIIAGLIGYWMVRQGIVETISTVLAASIIVRMILILVHGGGLIETPLL